MINIAGVRDIREQLWAEVLTIYQAEKLWLDDEELNADLDMLHKTVTDHGDWFELLSEKIPAKGDFKLGAMDAWRLVGISDSEINRITGTHRNQLKRALIGLGFGTVSKPCRRKGALVKAYIRGDEAKAEWWGDRSEKDDIF